MYVKLSTLRHSYRDSVILETIKSFDGHLEKKWSIFLVIKCKQRFFGFSSTICFSAGHGAQRCRGNWSKTGTQPNNYEPEPLPAVTYNIISLFLDDGLVT